jgi:23S rRNA pseudouridine1911/1915/1917 synthase
MILLVEHLNTLKYTSKEIKSLLKTGKVYFHGVPTADGRRIIDPRFIEIRPRAPRVTVGRDPVIIHKDTGFVVVYKPARYLSVPAPHRHKDPNILSFVNRLFKGAFAVHRLDEDTSGLMLVATKESTQKALKAQLEERNIQRQYLAIASGHMKKPQTIDTILTRDRGDGRRGVGAVGQRAISHFTPIEKLKGACVIQAQLDTGRTHQIRIHLSEHLHPILGDTLYSPFKIQRRAPRLALHACSLKLDHPHSGKSCQFKAPLADDLERLRRKLSQENKS